jgi:L-rhamnose mutarotase
MLAAPRWSGWRNYSLFMRSDGTLFGYFETPSSFEAALVGMAHEAIDARWRNFIAPFLEGVGAMQADQVIEALEQVSFHE